MLGAATSRLCGSGFDNLTKHIRIRALTQGARISSARCGSGVAICPGTDSGIPRMTSTPEQAHIGPEPPPINETLKSRGLGARYLGAGADGLYVFNFLQDNQVNVSMADGSYRYNTELLTELGRSVIHSLCRLSARPASRDSLLCGAWAMWVWLRAGRLCCCVLSRQRRAPRETG